MTSPDSAPGAPASAAVPPGYTYGYPAAQPTPPARPRPWVVTVAVVWGLVLAAGIGWAAVNGGPTAREQSTVAEALPVVDTATVEIVRAVNADGQAVAAISDLSKSADCSVTVVRSGQRYQRLVTAFVAPGTELALLRRVAQRLPAAYGTVIRPGAAPRLSADAGLYVTINAAVRTPGVVRFAVDTGDCRIPGAVPVQLSGEASQAQRAPAEEALARLGLPAAAFHLSRAMCPGGGEVTTVEAVTAKGVAPGPLDTPLSATSGQIAVSTPDLFAYRVDTVAVSARVVDDTVVVTATSSC